MTKQNKMMQMVHNRLRLTLNDGRTLVGQLLAYDKHMNLVLADCEESRVPRKATNKDNAPEMRRTLGLVMLRGEQIVSMSPEGMPAANRTRVPASQVMGRAAGMVPPPGAPVGMSVPVPGMYMAPPGMPMMPGSAPQPPFYHPHLAEPEATVLTGTLTPSANEKGGGSMNYCGLLSILLLLPVVVWGKPAQPNVPDFDSVVVGKGAQSVTSAKILSSPTLPTPRTGEVEPTMPQIPRTDKFWASFMTAFVMIVFSEMGDKTFLIATIMAMRHPRFLVFMASQLALTVMTVISAAFGLLLPNLIPRDWTQYVAAVLFFIFGIKMIREGWAMSPTHMRDEYEEVTLEIEDTEEATARRSTTRLVVREDGHGEQVSCLDPWQRRLLTFFSALRIDKVAPIAVQVFTLTFLAEWGDRSQIATIVLAAAQNVWGVTLGAVIGHAVCTSLAVLSGKILSNLLSIRTVTIFGGLLFIVFSILSIY